MYLDTLNIWNFRKYGILGEAFETAKPGLSVRFNQGVNVLIGENDSGKTSIIDAIRYVLRTQSGEFIQIEEKDFYQDKTGRRAEELKIECIFKGFSSPEAGHFLEWLGFSVSEAGQTDYTLKVWLYAKVKDNSIFQYIRAGSDVEGSYIEGEARELLKVVYLKPLRDALADMTHGNKSRLAQILKFHPIFKTPKDTSTGNKPEHELETKYKNLKKEVDQYFEKETEKGKEISLKLNKLLGEHFLIDGDERKAAISLAGSELSDILKQLDLILEANKSGLGSLNLLCIAAELLLFTEERMGLKLTLIEELEAHLHPQYQLRLIDFITQESDYGQFILTTHSTTLASKIPLRNLIICKDDQIYPLGVGTRLNPSDYNFLQRFLDATKANLFFAQGLIIVEGDAENLLIPTLAELIERPLYKYGVSIVNVGSTAFKRYVRIFEREKGGNMKLPISIISDLDVRSMEYYEEQEQEVPEVVIADEVFIESLKKITDEVDYDRIPVFFVAKADFDEFIKENKTVGRFKVSSDKKSIKVQLDEVYEGAKRKITKDIIEQLRKSRKAKLENEWNSDQIKIFLPQQWTLEYEIACSELYLKLEQAVRISKVEKNNPYKEIDTQIFEQINEEVKSDFEGKDKTEKLSYQIFQPLCDGSVSKASTAQYLAEILKKDNSVVDIIKSDVSLRYLVDAIYHVTQKDE